MKPGSGRSSRLRSVLLAATLFAAVSSPFADASVPGPRAEAPAAMTDTYYYRYQGSRDSGTCKSANCGPAVFAAAIGYAKHTWTAIQDVRAFVSGKSCRGTDYNDAHRVLDHWEVKTRPTSTLKELEEAVTTRGHPVLAVLYMGQISEGSDYLERASNPTQRFGRFHDYTYGHFVVVRGFSKDGRWVIIDDPYVFDGHGWGFYEGGGAKGHNRHVAYAEFEKAFRYFGLQGIEIIPD